MPKITVYVRDEDVDVFEKAKNIQDEGSLSSILARALKDYLEREEARARQMQEIDLPYGKRKLRFFGRSVAVYPKKLFPDNELNADDEFLEHFRYNYDLEDWLSGLPDPMDVEWSLNIEGGVAIRAYQTQKNKILLYRVMPSDDTGKFFCWHAVYNSYKEIQGLGLPEELLDDIAEGLGEELVEYLDV